MKNLTSVGIDGRSRFTLSTRLLLLWSLPVAGMLFGVVVAYLGGRPVVHSIAEATTTRAPLADLARTMEQEVLPIRYPPPVARARGPARFRAVAERSQNTATPRQVDEIATAEESAAAAADLQSHAGDISGVVRDLLRSIGSRRHTDVAGVPGTLMPGGSVKPIRIPRPSPRPRRPALKRLPWGSKPTAPPARVGNGDTPGRPPWRAARGSAGRGRGGLARRAARHSSAQIPRPKPRARRILSSGLSQTE